MGIWENLKAKREAKKQQEIDEEIEKREQSKGKKLNEKGVEKVIKKVEARRTRRGIRNTIIAILGSIGIAVGGQALLPDGNEGKGANNKTAIEMENETNTTNTKKEAYLKELRDMSQYQGTENLQEELSDTHIVDEILKMYNDNLLEQAEIDKDDLGIIFQDYVGEGHIIEQRSEDGKISYLENASKTTKDLQAGESWVESKHIGHVYVLVDNENNNTIAGIGAIDQQYHEIDVEQIRNNGIVYEKNDQTYVGLPEEYELRDIDENFGNYFQERQVKVEEEKRAEADNEMEH